MDIGSYLCGMAIVVQVPTLPHPLSQWPSPNPHFRKEPPSALPSLYGISSANFASSCSLPRQLLGWHRFLKAPQLFYPPLSIASIVINMPLIEQSYCHLTCYLYDIIMGILTVKPSQACWRTMLLQRTGQSWRVWKAQSCQKNGALYI